MAERNQVLEFNISCYTFQFAVVLCISSQLSASLIQGRTSFWCGQVQYRKELGTIWTELDTSCSSTPESCTCLTARYTVPCSLWWSTGIYLQRSAWDEVLNTCSFVLPFHGGGVVCYSNFSIVIPLQVRKLCSALPWILATIIRPTYKSNKRLLMFILFQLEFAWYVGTSFFKIWIVIYWEISN